MTVGDFQLPLAVLVVRGCAASGGSLCGREGGKGSPTVPERWRGLGSHQQHWYVFAGRKPGRKPVVQDREPGITDSPVLSLLGPGDNSPVALSAEGLLSQREQNPASFCLSVFLRVL